jgi:hypothetical protein
MANLQGIEDKQQLLTYEDSVIYQLGTATVGLYQEHTYGKRSLTFCYFCEADRDQDYQYEVPMSTQGHWDNEFGK